MLKVRDKDPNQIVLYVWLLVRRWSQVSKANFLTVWFPLFNPFLVKVPKG